MSISIDLWNVLEKVEKPMHAVHCHIKTLSYVLLPFWSVLHVNNSWASIFLFGEISVMELSENDYQFLGALDPNFPCHGSHREYEGTGGFLGSKRQTFPVRQNLDARLVNLTEWLKGKLILLAKKNIIIHPKKRYGHYQVTFFGLIHHWKTSWAAANHQQAHLQASRSTAKVGISWQILRLWWDTFGLKIIEQIEWHGSNIHEYPIACIWVLIVPSHNYHYENLQPSYFFF